MVTTYLSCRFNLVILVILVNVDIQRLIHLTGAQVAMRA